MSNRVTAPELASSISKVANALAYLRGAHDANLIDVDKFMQSAAALDELASLAERRDLTITEGVQTQPLDPRPLRDLAAALRDAAQGTQRPLPRQEIDLIWYMFGGTDEDPD